MIKTFINKGANPNIDPIFTRTYPDIESFEDEVCGYSSRGMLIDMLHEILCDKGIELDVFKYVDWHKIKAVYWEYVPAGTDYNIACLMALKNTSKYLKEFEEVEEEVEEVEE